MIYVVGSSNTDMVVKSERLPGKGETVIGDKFLMNPGGKGANQAVSAARVGGTVNFVCKVGNDLFGKQAIQQFGIEKIHTGYITIDDVWSSGVALINVDANGENCISVAPGANNYLSKDDVSPALEQIGDEDILLIQLEIPLETVVFSVTEAARNNARIILNPAPATTLPDHIYRNLFLITPNETEAELLTGVKVTDEISASEAADWLLTKGCENVIITLGSKGAFLRNKIEKRLIASPKVTAIDTTAAGDCFNGALAVAISEGKDLVEAVSFACKAAALSVARMGAQGSLPTRHEVDAFQS
ncbi:ribokinase [Dyadobacter luticola]|uniref:Ribokinase n=1 Tax=Dyadobacter luticola TaxID=1979387 RepID=A0A5R9L416_9BACT|nr:ribokinase [Dyadobacter luticola]TLV03324.1 ribokinase [Dyadobacter luticola]